jgi:hypothetical protein
VANGRLPLHAGNRSIGGAPYDDEIIVVRVATMMKSWCGIADSYCPKRKHANKSPQELVSIEVV